MCVLCVCVCVCAFYCVVVSVCARDRRVNVCVHTLLFAPGCVVNILDTTVCLCACVCVVPQEGVSGSKLFRDIGNVSEDSQFSFEYSTRPPTEVPPALLDGLTELPFQVESPHSHARTLTHVPMQSN